MKIYLINLPATLIVFFCFFACQNSTDKAVDDYISADSLYIIPKPTFIEKREGYFMITDQTNLIFSADLQNEGNYFSKLIDSSSTFSIKQNQKSNGSEIELRLVNDFPIELQNGEAYRLLISPEKMQITALSSTGIMRGIQTIRQMLVPEFSSKEKSSSWSLPCVKIEDKPAFEHRGLLLDVCRHFFSKEVVMKYIDLLALYKMNVLHFHLTEDQGWRIESEKYPLLNTISSFRKEKDGTTYGGYYTKEDLKEIVAYAKERHVVVIPEIELPGHAQAALAAYPQYSCNGGNIEVANDWGVFKEIYCAGNDSTFIFLEEILLEVMEIFPSEYIHIGGDEAPKFRWENCMKCQKRMKEENLHDEHELQSYFIQRIEKFLNDNGRKLIGWDEILEGGLSENATVQSWRGMEGGKAAAEQKHFAIMSPTSHCYLDYDLDNINLKKVYWFNPIPENLSTEFHPYILGAECNMWTEHVPDENNLDSKVFPRMIAFAEVLWSGADTNRYEDFYQRLQKHYALLGAFNVAYGMESTPFKIISEKTEKGVLLKLNEIHSGIEIQYRLMKEDTSNWKTYPVEGIHFLRSDIVEFKIIKSGKEYGERISQEIAVHLANFKSVSYTTKWNDWYASEKELALVDGKLGSKKFRDGNWQGFWGNDLNVIIDFGEVKEFSSIILQFLEYTNAWIMQPRGIEFYVSDDGARFTSIPEFSIIEVNTDIVDGISVNPYIFKFRKTSARYLKVVAVNYGKMPASHETAGQDAWLFIDEIIVE